MASLLINPRKRGSKKRKYKKNPIDGIFSKRRVARAVKRASPFRKYRRNPINTNNLKKDFMESAKSGAIGAVGAILSEVVLGKLPLPASLQSGTGLTLVKGLVGVGVGFFAAKVAKNKKVGVDMANGAMTIALHDTIRGALKGPLGLSNDSGLLGYGGDSYNDDTGLLGYYSPTSAYAPEINNSMGYYENSDY
jgi:hypothetical protein